MLLRLYSLLMWLVQPLLRRRLRRRGLQEPGYLEAVPERFGHYDRSASDAKAGWVWVHAVSLGETRAAAVLLAELRRQYPGLRLLLTHGTATGRAEGRALLREGDVQVWQPWDAAEPVARFLDHFKPQLGVLLETEVWPNLVAACARRQLPLVLVNARLSEKSLRNALRLAWLARPSYAALAAVYAQTEADAERLRQIGAPVRGVFGNLKFDARPDPVLLARGRHWREEWQAQSPGRSVVLFASSREGEEAMLLRELSRLSPAQRARTRWLIVPRHPQRFDAVASLVQEAGFSLSRRSQWPAHGLDAGEAEVWLGDSLGEMALYYALSDVALLGGSFLPLGGQNLIEAAACDCPVVMGPHTFNFAEAAANSAAAGAAFVVADLSEAMGQVFRLLQNRELLSQCQSRCQVFLTPHQGAAGRTASSILASLFQ